MKFTLSWLKDHLKTKASVEEISTTLSAIGLEVESVEDPGEKLGAFKIARIVEAKQHPNADRLRVVQVEIEKGKPPVEVVCGAPNARAGLVGVFAPLGTYIPGSDITLEKKPVRGVVSNGMMCSEAELELSSESDGIIELGAGHGRACRRALHRRDGSQRPRVRGEADAEPAGLYGRARHRARSRRGRAWYAEARNAHPGCRGTRMIAQST